MINIKDIQVEPSMFYNVGMWLFGIAATMNTYFFLITISIYSPAPMISRIASLGFNWLIFLFFRYLRSTIPDAGMELAPEEDMAKMMDDFKSKSEEEPEEKLDDILTSLSERGLNNP